MSFAFLFPSFSDLKENDKKIKLPDNLFYISSYKLHVILINETRGEKKKVSCLVSFLKFVRDFCC
jgi:hypothetical protein